MPNLLNSFGRVKTYVDNSGYEIFNSATPGTYSINLQAGLYRIILIGGGGGGAHCFWQSGQTLNVVKAQGGVGATIDCSIRVIRSSTATLIIGAGGTTRTSIDHGAASVSGVSGENTVLSGIPDVTLVANGGTGGIILSGSPTRAGEIGVAAISGSNIVDVTMNSNDHPIISGATSGWGANGPVKNTNYMPNTALGEGGGTADDPLHNPVTYAPGGGYCYIEKI